jgi:citrate lyase subunit beta/citryl-CoA lyase
MLFRPRRSVLYIPGFNERALTKARSLPADAFILDLEDSVAPEAKEAARQRVCEAARAGGFGAREVIIRINGFDTPWGQADLAAAAEAGPDAILVPKVSAPVDIDRASDAVAKAGASNATRLWVMVETPLAVLNLREIAAAARHSGSRLACFVMGTNDLGKETRADLGADRLAGLFWLSCVVVAARAYGLDVIDGVYNDFRDVQGFRRECEQARRLGFDGKTLIHPDQVAIANEVFAPSRAELEWAEKIVAAFALPENRGKGAISVEGRMVELLHGEIARRTLAIAKAIDEMSARYDEPGA